jgi:hypothetical protein
MRGVQRSGIPCGTLAGPLWIALLAIACAGDLAAIEGGFEHRRHGYTIGFAPEDGGAWRRVPVDDAVLSFRRVGTSAWMSLQSRCGVPLAPPQILARHLRVGVETAAVRSSVPIELDGWPGWSQVFDARDAEGEVRVKTVTVVARRCIVDWVLVARQRFSEVEPLFDAWWGTFRLVPEPAGERTE